MTCPLILVTNDDGIRAPQLALLADALASVGEVWVYAPEGQQSAVGHGVSLHRPLRATEIRERWFMVDGTPTDCVMLAVRSLLPSRPKLVVSGINPGPNLGDDVTYSGTVAGAYEGMLLGIPSFSISSMSHKPAYADSAARFAVTLAAHILERGLPDEAMLNVNVPDLPWERIEGVSFTSMGRRNYQDEIIKRKDPRGRTYYWIGGADPAHFSEQGTDFDAIEHNRISVTPLKRDITNHLALETLRGWTLDRA